MDVTPHDESPVQGCHPANRHGRRDAQAAPTGGRFRGVRLGFRVSVIDLQNPKPSLDPGEAFPRFS